MVFKTLALLFIITLLIANPLLNVSFATLEFVLKGIILMFHLETRGQVVGFMILVGRGVMVAWGVKKVSFTAKPSKLGRKIGKF